MESLKKSPENKKNMGVLSASKSVKFQKDKTPLSQKKKFAKTPHSSKTPKESNNILDESTKKSPFRNKRKLSFSSAAKSPPSKSPKLSPELTASLKKKQKKSQLEDDSESDDEILDEQNSLLSDDSVSGTEDNTTISPKKPDVKTNKKKSKEKKKNITPQEKLAGKVDNTIFVGNLPINITTVEIKKEFTKFGLILNARLRCIPLNKDAKNKKAGVVLKQFDGKSASAFVKFGNLEAAKKALENNGKLIKGHHIRVDLADPSLREETDKRKAVFIRQLHRKLTEDELWSAFENCGKIHSVRIITDKQNYQGRGLGYVNFTTTSAVELALKLSGTEIKGKPIVVHRCETVVPKPRENRFHGGKTGKAALNGSPGKKKNVFERNQRKGREVKSELESDFTGNKSQIIKKKKPKKVSGTDMKKKKISEILAKQ